MARRKYHGLEKPLTPEDLEASGGEIINFRMSQLIKIYKLDENALKEDMQSPWATLCIFLIQDLIPGFQLSTANAGRRKKRGAKKTHHLFGDLTTLAQVKIIQQDKGLTESAARKAYAKRLSKELDYEVRDAQIRASIERAKKFEKLSEEQKNSAALTGYSIFRTKGIDNNRFKRKARHTTE